MAPKVLLRNTLLILLFVWSAEQLLAQNQTESIKLTAGIELRGLLPISFFTMDSVNLLEVDNNFNAVYSYTGGIGFGGVIRVKFTELWNLETGIYYTRRNFKYEVRDPSVSFNESTTMSTVGYEIPIKGLVYIQMGRRVFMDVALGVSADFFASDTEVQQLSYNIQSFKNAWVKLGVLGSIGAEYRTEKDGYFYLGATFHQPFGDTFTTQVNYYRENQGKAYFQNGAIDGAYFSVDFKYLFPPKAPKKDNVKRVIPDWKNMNRR
ncbi:MAG TPA: outer membrane beta-barrel protein [Flavobacteriaceae bacterium]|nr:outer membrane beta-barrel protein [Flavobacteriaceae bacterium]